MAKLLGGTTIYGDLSAYGLISGYTASITNTLTSTYIVGSGTETVMTDGTSLVGNGNGTFTLNYTNGFFVSCSAVPSTDNAYVLGNASNRWKAVYAANGTIQTSDARQKTNITPSPLGLNFINTLNPVSYNFIIGSNDVQRNELGDIISVTPVSGKRTHFGLIAQEVQQSIPPGIDFGGWILTDINDKESAQGLRYEEFIAPMIKSIQELTTAVNLLSSQNRQILNTLGMLPLSSN